MRTLFLPLLFIGSSLFLGQTTISANDNPLNECDEHCMIMATEMRDGLFYDGDYSYGKAQEKANEYYSQCMAGCLNLEIND